MELPIVISGAGLCGTALAILLAQKGHEVLLFERRSDMRLEEYEGGRSINLALSDRGLATLDLIGLREEVEQNIIPMYGRMIKKQGGEPKLFKYSGRDDEYINSVSRSGLNIILLNAAEKLNNLTITFDTKVKDYDFEKSTVGITDQITGRHRTIECKAIFAADGAGSAMRRAMTRMSNQIRFNFSQQFLDTGYKELSLPAVNGDYAIEKNALHIWPRDGFMMIALPNLDKTFTLTLFNPFEGKNGFDTIQTPEEIEAFFTSNFPDLNEFHAHLIEDYKENPSSSLGTIRCYPWALNNAVLMGDSAHAIVPFYGQGMNCALEDVLVLNEILEAHPNEDWAHIFQHYQEKRKVDTDAIADLAEDNFYEMRDSTADPIFNKKRQIELRLEEHFSEYYSKYSLVTFKEDLPYHVARDKGRKQDKILMEIAEKTEDAGQADLGEVLQEVKKKMEG